MNKYVVKLSEEQRKELEDLLQSGEAPTRKLTHARILLKTDCGEHGPAWPMSKICEAFDVSTTSVTSVRKSFVEGDLEKALERKSPEREYRRRIDGDGEAHLIAITCSEPPEGYERWSLRRLQSEMVSRGYVETVSHEAIRLVLKKTNSNRG
jgi:hypothetical protein